MEKKLPVTIDGREFQACPGRPILEWQRKRHLHPDTLLLSMTPWSAPAGCARRSGGRRNWFAAARCR